MSGRSDSAKNRAAYLGRLPRILDQGPELGCRVFTVTVGRPGCTPVSKWLGSTGWRAIVQP